MSDLTPWGCNGPLGTWKVEGTTPAGKTYDGELVLARVYGTADVLSAAWKTSIGNFTGLGLLHTGHVLLARIPGVVEAKKAPGIVWYTLTGSGDLDAVWSIGVEKGRIGTGFATGGIPGCLIGRRRIHYFDPDGNAAPTLDLHIYPDGETFRLVWSDGDRETHDGVGLPTAMGLCSAWSPVDQKAAKTLLVMAAESTDRARAVTATQGEPRLGEEILQRICGPSA